MATSLFRAEALSARAQAGGGLPLQFQGPTLAALTAAAVLAAALVLWLGIEGRYTRKEHVTGYVAPSLGLLRLPAPPQPAMVTRVAVHEGQAVRRGEVLLELSTEQASTGTPETQASMQAERLRRRDSLRRVLDKQRRIDGLATEGLDERRSALDSEIRQAEAQLALQKERVDSAWRSVQQQTELVASRYVAEATLQQKRDQWLEQRHQQMQQERNLAGLRREAQTLRIDRESSRLQGSNTVAATERELSELEQQITEAEARRSVVLTAPGDGTVTALLATVGQATTPGRPLLSLLPTGGRLQAQLLVPSRAVGFIRVGQTVALRYQAFPYQRFGHHAGRIVELSRSVIQAQDASLPLPVQEPVYRVTVELPAQAVRAYGQAMPLQAGMLLDADIHVDRRRLVEWIFEPLIALGGRL